MQEHIIPNKNLKDEKNTIQIYKRFNDFGNYIFLPLTEELDDYEPLYSLDAEDAIDTQETAELALVGAYSGFTQKEGSPFPDMFIIPDVLSG
ncbi:hypothetical protein [Zunongwangia endophytica]|uniref:hypothetical protein n=1 Tax=Zunongwangia endophytica TaxID=1808945 RepID=UPI0025B5421D|nr:hypothetical protein [Zunongwangia endophytica]MDN3596965.1 hypothetical protein [Zunongwangia endophytica]